MAKRRFDWNVQRFTNVRTSGGSTSNPQFVPFDFGNYGFVNAARLDIDVSCVALESTDNTNAYSVQYIARIVYTWSIASNGTIVRTIGGANDSVSTFNFTVDTGGSGIVSGNNGMLRVQGHASGTNIWSIVCAARILNCVEY